jgi:hypothetical protein
MYQCITSRDAYSIARFGLTQFNQFPIGKMDMSNSANSALNKLDVVDCLRPAVLAKAAVLQQFFNSGRKACLINLIHSRKNDRFAP